MLWMAVSVTILLDGEIRRVENGLMTEQECRVWAADMSSITPPVIDPVSKQALMSRAYVCESVSSGKTPAP